MNERGIRCPKGPATIFLIHGISYFFTLFSTVLLTQITGEARDMEPLAIFRIVLWGATNLIMSIVLFSKKYNNILIAASTILFVPSFIGIFFNISPYLISEIAFYLILIAFTYIMVNMPEKPIREKAVKFRFIIPVFQFVLILISTIQTMHNLYEKLVETMGSPLSDGMNIAIVLLPPILGAVAGFLPVLCYAWLANWLAEPYKK